MNSPPNSPDESPTSRAAAPPSAASSRADYVPSINLPRSEIDLPPLTLVQIDAAMYDEEMVAEESSDKPEVFDFDDEPMPPEYAAMFHEYDERAGGSTTKAPAASSSTRGLELGSTLNDDAPNYIGDTVMDEDNNEKGEKPNSKSTAASPQGLQLGSTLNDDDHTYIVDTMMDEDNNEKSEKPNSKATAASSQGLQLGSTLNDDAPVQYRHLEDGATIKNDVTSREQNTEVSSMEDGLEKVMEHDASPTRMNQRSAPVTSTRPAILPTTTPSSPSAAVPPDEQTTTSAPMLEATPVDDRTIHMHVTYQQQPVGPVYDGVAIQNEEELSPWRERNQKYILTGLCLLISAIIAATVAAMVSSQSNGGANESNQEEGVPQITLQPMPSTTLKSSVQPTDSISDQSPAPSEELSLAPSQHPSLRPSLPLNIWKQRGQGIDGKASEDGLGRSVALSANGMTMAVGARGNDENGNDSGIVYVYGYVLDGDSMTWLQVGQGISGEAPDDQSGTSVSLSADGTTLAIGSHLNDENGIDSGNVRIYSWDDDTLAWSPLGQSIDGESAYDWSGFSIVLSADGLTLAIGAHRNDDNGRNSGMVRIYRWDSDVLSWGQLGQHIYGEGNNDTSGYSVALSSDGMILAIGAPRNENTNGICAGHVRVYRWDYESLSWIRLGQDVDGETNDGWSGNSMALSADGMTLAIGAYRNDDSGKDSGQVRIYKWNDSASTWVKLGQDINGEADYESVGWSVAFSADGMTLAIGAPYFNFKPYNEDDSEALGQVYVYGWDGDTLTWSKLGREIYGDVVGDRTGYSVALSSDGMTLAIGAPRNNGNGYRSGNVRVFNIEY